MINRESELKKLKSVEYDIQFVKPGMKQQSLLIQFMVEICKELIFTKQELETKNNVEITQKCIEKFTTSSEEIKQHIGMAMLSNSKTFDLLYSVFIDCFPEITRPQDLKDEVFSELLELVMESITF